MIVDLAAGSLVDTKGIGPGFSYTGIENFTVSDTDSGPAYALLGNSNDNILIGSNGGGFGFFDVLEGRGGNDTLTGDFGGISTSGLSDWFAFDATTQGGTDTITDFQDGIDRIGLIATQYGLTAGGSVAGVLSVSAGTNLASLLHFDTATNTLYSAVNGPLPT